MLTVRLPCAFTCGTCEPEDPVVSTMARVSLEPIFDDGGELVGLKTVARYPGCGHRMSQVRMYEEDVAMVMEMPTASQELQAFMLTNDDLDEEG